MSTTRAPIGTDETTHKPKADVEIRPGYAGLPAGLLQRKIQRRALQRKADGEKKDAKKEDQDGATKLETFTVTNGTTLIYGEDLKPTRKVVPEGARVAVHDSKKDAHKHHFVRAKDLDTGADYWIARGSGEDLDAKYAASKPEGKPLYVYHAGGHDVLVFVPPGIKDLQRVDIFMFFHGNGGNYAGEKTHKTKTDGFDDNPAKRAQIAEAAAASGRIAICPQAKEADHLHTDWEKIASGFRQMVDVALRNLSDDLDKKDKPLKPGEISLAGHSSGGGPLGRAAQELEEDGDRGVTDVTLLEAGYGFVDSFAKLRDWFLTGKTTPKTIRIITQYIDGKGGGAGMVTRTLAQPSYQATWKDKEGKEHSEFRHGALVKEQIEGYSQQLVKQKKLTGPVKVIEELPNTKEGDLILERVDHVLRSDGGLQGSLRLYHMAKESDDHWAVSGPKNIAGSMGAGKADRATDAKWAADHK